MFSRLSINNYALIEALEMRPHGAMNIITGETGAGKSIMLGAVGLLLGNRADTKVLYNIDRKCIIEGEFNIAAYNLKTLFDKHDLDYEPVSLIRREITPSGKTRAFVNDTPVNLDTLKELGTHLMDIHSQHQTLLLGNSDYQLNVIDSYAEAFEELKNYKSDYHNFREASSHLKHLINTSDKLSQESDYNTFLLQELVDAQLEEDEQLSLEEELKILEHAEEIKSNLNAMLLLLDRNELNLSALLQEARNLSNQISNYGESFLAINNRLKETSIELTDVIRDIEDQEGIIDVDFERAEQVRERISLIYHLQNKHHADDIAGLLAIQHKLEEETFIANNLEEEIAKAKQARENAQNKLEQSATILSNKRKDSFATLEQEIIALLVKLGMPDAQLVIDSHPKEPGENGADDIVFRFSANKGVAPAVLNKVASGGEFSRLMFCFKYVMASKTKLPTMVFDEIDAGISGEIALQMGTMIQEMAKEHQVITISHLPQIAARGQAHYFVFKDVDGERSVSKVRQLSDEEKIVEVAKMIGGDFPTDSAYASARELIAMSA